MTVTQESTKGLNATLKVHFNEDDYKDNVEKVLKDYQRKANIPGFRPGKVPAGMIRKMYGKAVMAEEIDKLLSESIEKYIEENKIEILGSPLPNSELNKTIDLDNQKEFEFYFDLGLSPEVNIELNDNIKINEYEIIANDTDVDRYIDDIRKKYGSLVQVEFSENKDMVTGDFEELNDKDELLENGRKNSSSVFVEHIPDKETTEQFTGLKVGDVVVVDPKKVAKNNYEISYLTGVKNEEVEALTSKFRFTVKSISRIQPAELNEDFFLKIDKTGKIKTEEELRDTIMQDTLHTYKSESSRHFMSEIQKALIDQAKIELPDEFLKRYFLETSKDEKMTAEKVEADYAQHSNELRWQVIEHSLVKKYGITVEEKDAKEYVKSYFRPSIGKKHDHDHDHEHHHEHEHEHDHDHEHHHEHHHEHDHEHEHEHDHDEANHEENTEMQLENISSTVLSNKEQAKKIYETIFDLKMNDLYRKHLSITPKKVTYEEFILSVTK